MGQRFWYCWLCVWTVPLLSANANDFGGEVNPLNSLFGLGHSDLTSQFPDTADTTGGIVAEGRPSVPEYRTPFEIGLTTDSKPRSSSCQPEEVLEFPSLESLLSFVGGESLETHEEGEFRLCTFYCKIEEAEEIPICGWFHEGSIVLKKGKEASTQSQIDQVFDQEEEGNNELQVEGSDEGRAKRSTERRKRKRRKSPLEAPVILGISFEYESDKKRVEYDRFGSPRLLENMPVTIRLYGRFDNSTEFRLTKFHDCNDSSYHHEPIVKVQVDSSGTSGTVDVVMPKVAELYEVFLCVRNEAHPFFKRQGEFEEAGQTKTRPWLVIKLYKAIMPLWLHLFLLALLLSLSGLFSGLNLGLMSLNKTDLKIIINTGTVEERNYASSIAPVRNHGNFLLCCLLFSNVLVNASLTILVDDLTSGLIAIIMSTLAIVIFGEIIPQAICSRHGLAVGAKTIYITKFFMFITAPLALPLSKLLDRLLGEEIGSVYTRERLKELLRVTKDYHGLCNEEVGIISGALDMKSKTVKDIMVSLDSAFMLPIDAVLDFDTMLEVEYHGYSRIPIYDRERKNIVGLLNIKQLTLLDANDKIPLRTVVEYYRNKVFFVFENARLDFMLKAFREGSYGHMAFVQKINDEGPGDPFYETMGLLTMEDVLEELLQAEIMDESDIGKHEARLANSVRPKNTLPAALMKHKPSTKCDLAEPLALATVQFLTTSVEPFDENLISRGILERLVKGCSHHIKLPRHRSSFPDIFLYEVGKPNEFFILILEGKVEVKVGKENLTYNTGAFTSFGKDFLIATLAAEKTATISSTSSGDKADGGLTKKRPSFIPDYSVRVVSESLNYLMLKFSAYRSAILATTIERTNADPTKPHDKNWQEEIDKMLEKISSIDEDNPSESSRRPRMSRDESFRTPNLAFAGDSEELSRKVSLATVGESPSLNFIAQDAEPLKAAIQEGDEGENNETSALLPSAPNNRPTFT